MTAKLPQFAPDIAEAIRFLKIIAPEGNVMFQTFDDDKKKKRPWLIKILHGSIEGNYTKLAKLNHDGAGIFFMVNRGDGKGRKAVNVTGVRAVCIDLDEDGQEKRKRLEKLTVGAPRLIVESSPGKYHVYWLIDGQLPLDCFQRVQKHFIKTFDSDPQVCGLPHVLRLPGFFHNKYEPFMSRIVFDNPEAKLLPADVLAKKVAVPEVALPNNEFQIENTPQGLPEWLSIALEYIDPSEYNTWLQVGMSIHHGSSGSAALSAEGLAVFDTWSQTASNYSAAACAAKWASFGSYQGEKLSVGTIAHLAKIGGWQGPRVENLTDVGNGKRLIRFFGKDLRHVPQSKKWLMYSNGLWDWDKDGAIRRKAKETTALMMKEALQIKDDAKRLRSTKHALGTENSFRLKAMVDMAATEKEAVLPQSSLDRDPDMLGTASGVLNLKTGEIRPGRRSDYITKKSSVEMTSTAGGCPVWLDFLEKVMDRNEDLIKYLQRGVGYSLTAHTSEQCLFFLHGLGANGKSTFMNVLQELMGDYCIAADPETIMLKSSSSGATPELARLLGARAIITIETEEGKRLAENRVKQMTGGDTMIARHLYKDPFEFKPEFKIWIAGNHKPSIRGNDHAIWRRIHLVPFTVTIPKGEQDPRLGIRLREELPGIMQWAVEGCMMWRRQGLKPPKQITDAVAEYRSEMDIMKYWLDECCIFDPTGRTESSVLYGSYKAWCSMNGHYPLSHRRFSTALKEREGKELTKIKSSRVSWAGIRLKPLQRGVREVQED